MRKISIKFIEKEITYTGEQIAPLWAFENFNIKGDSIIIFIGRLKVKRENLVDAEDKIEAEKEKEEFPISADKALNFIAEHFDSADLRLAYHRQRILIFSAMEKIEEFCGKKLERKHSDIYFNGKKLSVSIANRGLNSHKIHFALNIASTGFPENVECCSLSELGINKRDVIKKLGIEIAERYAEEIEKIELDIAKTKCHA